MERLVLFFLMKYVNLWIISEAQMMEDLDEGRESNVIQFEQQSITGSTVNLVQPASEGGPVRIHLPTFTSVSTWFQPVTHYDMLDTATDRACVQCALYKEFCNAILYTWFFFLLLNSKFVLYYIWNP